LTSSESYNYNELEGATEAMQPIKKLEP
jgi:hypothetical protein